MKTKIAALVVLLTLTLASPAWAGGVPKVNPLPWVPVPPVKTSAPTACPGVTAIRPVKEWDFSEAAGSHGPFKELNGAAADDLAVTSYGGTVTGNGTSVGFTDDAILRTAGNIFNPENADLVMCVGFQVDDPNGYNLDQINNAYPLGIPSDHGQLKQTGWYNQPGGADGWFHLKCRTGNPPHDVAGLELNGTGWHTVTLYRHGDTFYTYFDGKLSSSVSKPGSGPIHLDAPLSVGGKLLEGGATPHDSDLLRGRVAWVKV